MKKLIFGVILSLFLISLAYASQIIVIKDTVKPNIAATFNETVTLKSYSWISGAVYNEETGEGKKVADNSTIDGKTFIFTPKTPLMNGVYLFTANALDEIGNLKIFERTIIINVPQTEISFKDPLHGIGRIPIFDAILETSREAICRWSFLNNVLYESMSSSSFESESMSLYHTIKYSSLRPWKTTLDAIHVKCIDSLGLNIKNDELQIGYDNTPPVIKVTTNSPVKTYPPIGEIRVESDDKSICYIDNAVFSNQNRLDASTYKRYSVGAINYAADPSSANGIKTYRVKCENLAGLFSSENIVQISVELAENLALYVYSPLDYMQGTLKYGVTSNKPAQDCSWVLTTPSATVTSPPILTDVSPTNHTLIPQIASLPSGNYIVDFECKSVSEVATIRKPFVVDKTPPSAAKINATACTKDKLSLSFKSYDNESGIGGYSYSVAGKNVSINWANTTANSAELTGLKMNLGSSYTISVKATNRAGMQTPTAASILLTFNPNITLACQEKVPPTIRLNVTNTTYGKQVAILCYDASGCDAYSIKYGVSDTQTCNATISYFNPILFTKPQWICWFAKDKWGTPTSGSQFIQLKATGTTCTNGISDGTETDKDCGGSCLGCAVGAKCSVNKDCAENYCNNKVCQKPLCTDTIKNGFESDADCGGSSCSGCSLGRKCAANSDCSSNACNISVGKTEGLCIATSCSDDIKNGFETDTDCGGPDCTIIKCGEGKTCASNSDCSSGLCEFAVCSAGKETEEIIPIAEAPSNLYRYLLLIIGILALIMGFLFLTYFKTDQNSYVGMFAIGGFSILLVIIDWLLFLLPKYVLVPAALIALLAAGYLTYSNQLIIMRKISGKPQLSEPSSVQKQTGTSQAIVDVKPRLPETKTEKQEFEATKVMLAMMKKQKLEKENKREEMFSSFDKDKGIKKEIRKVEAKKETIKPIEPIKKEIRKTNLKLPEKAQAKSSEFDRLSSISKGNNTMERLSNISKGGMSDLDRLRKKEEAFNRLSSLPKSNVEDVFSKLPRPESALEKKKKRGKNEK